MGTTLRVVKSDELITQRELAGYNQLTVQAKELKVKIANKEDEIFERLEGGAEVEEGFYSAQKKNFGKKSVGWKELYVDLYSKVYGKGKGEKRAAKILADTEPNENWGVEITGSE